MKIKIYCHGPLNCLPASESANVGSRCPGLAGSGERASSVLDPGMCSPVNIRAEQRRRRATGTHPPHESSHGYLSLCMCRALAPAFRSLPPFALCWFVPVWARNPGLVTGPLAASQRTVRASCACVAGRSEVPVPCDATASHAMAPADVSVICHQQLHHRRDLLPRRREAAALTAWHRKLGRLDGD
jgi:hypothetical protein